MDFAFGFMVLGIRPVIRQVVWMHVDDNLARSRGMLMHKQRSANQNQA